MDFFSTIFSDIIYRPILNLLVAIYNILPGHDFGIVIILVTLAVRLLLAPFMHRSMKSQAKLAALQPKITELKEKHKDDQQAHAAATMELYKEHGVNPFSSCLPLLLQLPILIGLYQVFQKALSGNLNGLYNFVSHPGSIDPHFLGSINLAHASILLAIISGIAQFAQVRVAMAYQPQNPDPMIRMQTNLMMYIFPVLSIFIALRLPAGLPLYWIVTTLVTAVQQYIAHLSVEREKAKGTLTVLPAKTETESKPKKKK